MPADKPHGHAHDEPSHRTVIINPLVYSPEQENLYVLGQLIIRRATPIAIVALRTSRKIAWTGARIDEPRLRPQRERLPGSDR